MKTITLNINNKDYITEVEPRDLLIDVIRNNLKLYGTKKGCGTGECGACSVIYDGDIVNACLILAVRAEGHKIETIEGLAEGKNLTLLQQQFIENAAVQCGFCGPGMIMSAKVLLNENPNPTEREIREGIAGNVCRCSGYVNIVKAIDATAKLGGGK